jgi:ribosomal protein L40E
LFPPNVTGRAQLTRSDGTRIDLTRSNLNDVGPGTSVNTEKSSFVRISTPKTTLTNSHSVVGENSSLSWLDPRPYLPWLKLPYASLGNVERLLLQPNFGKLLLNWMETDASQEALLVLPAGLIGVAAADETRRWLARVKGTMLLVEANENRTTAAITVLEDPTKPGSVELWRSDDTGKVIEIHSGERVILKTGQPPTKMTVNFAPGLTQQIQDPFNVLHRWWTLPPASDESLTALETPSMGSKLSTGMTAAGSPPPQNAFCSECGQALPKPNSKFCTKCGAAQGNAGDVGKCRKCGEPLRPGKKFCMKCGTPTGQS